MLTADVARQRAEERAKVKREAAHKLYLHDLARREPWAVLNRKILNDIERSMDNGGFRVYIRPDREYFNGQPDRHALFECNRYLLTMGFDTDINFNYGSPIENKLVVKWT
ncbi:hypothetical protein [Delftia phage PhiW-14]|uniref:Uncharacterized protein n=1 Tax=Delftia phage PhiW-14 TaxID=665032 RepID=C9DGC8_BPW14|nr:hypothetical protein DP-phiW-14_gp158 [Delftia phage PhiW-14]ACV50179.1 hypothetical protein [Delftia phage PhiW-14]